MITVENLAYTYPGATQETLHGLNFEIEVMNREVSAWGPDYYEHVGVSFELPNHYLKLTALENLNHFELLLISAGASLAAPIAALFYATFAENKVLVQRFNKVAYR